MGGDGMNTLDKIIGFFSPEKAYRREMFRREWNAMQRHGYDAGSFGRLNSGWAAFNESAEMTDRNERDVIRARARDLERNSDMMNSVLSAFVRNIVGNGFQLQAKTEDETLNKQIEELWHEWTHAENCDVTGQQSLNQMLRMAVRRKKIDGGILFKKCYTKGGVVPFKLQAIEVDELCAAWERPKSKYNKVAGGIEYNAYNKPVGFWLQQYSIDGMEMETPQYYDAKDIIFLFSKRRPSQVRELSDMSPTLTRIRDANEFITAVSVKERIAACLSVFIKKAVPIAGIGRNASGVSAASASYEGKKLSPGMIAEMNAGDEIQVVDPKGGGGDAANFLKMQQRLIGSGQGLSYEATSRDMSETNYSSARQSNIEDDLTYSEDVELLQENLMDNLFESFLVSAVLSGALAIPDFWERRAAYTKHTWVASPKRWIDPLKEATANKVALESGQKTFQQIAAENGRDWRSQIDEMAEAQHYAHERGVQIGGIVNGEAFGEGTSGRNA